MIFVLKVPKEKASVVLAFVKKNKLVDFSFEVLKEGNHVFIPVIKNEIPKKFSFASFVKKDLKKRFVKETDLKSSLKSKLSKEELELLTTAFDVVGTVAIIEIPDLLAKREKLIAESLLKINKNVKTVLKKSGIHEGPFRTQKLSYLAGEKTKEGTHRENNVFLKLDVETVYFSIRSSNERKRIASLVKPGEQVLVMFSGCAPFVCVIAKNSKAGMVYGVEFNPIAHKYALENIRTNHLSNAVALWGDVRKVVPNFYQHILGLKSSIESSQIKPRLVKDPKRFEFHLHDDDLFKNINFLKKRIVELKEKGICVVLHAPIRHAGKVLSLDSEDIESELEVFNILGNLCREFGVDAIVHVGFEDNNYDVVVNNIKRFSKFFDCFYFENSTTGCFSRLETVLDISRASGLKNLCVDVSHAFIVYKDNEEVAHFINSLRSEFGTYFHFNDSNGREDSLRLGSGLVDWESILSLVSKGVVEVESANEDNPVEMLSSFDLLAGRFRKFDRIIMPLPASAEKFLDIVFSVSKRGTVVHFYDFSKESEIPNLSVDKIKGAAESAEKKIKILGHAICGNYGPGIYRVCIDFEIL